METSTITVNVQLDDDKIPEQISWKASASTAEEDQKATAMMLSFWDAADKSALRIDLWTKNMMIDEMADFYYQTLMTMADAYGRATQQVEMVDDMKNFARSFYKKIKDAQLKASGI